MSQQPRPEQTPRQPQTAEEKRKKSLQEYKKMAEQNKNRWMPLVRYMKKHNIKFKTARCEKVRIECFRTEELEDLIAQNKESLEKDSVLKELIKSWNKDVVYFQRPENAPKLKYPKQLEKSQGNAASKFASFKFDTAESRNWLFPTIVLAVIAVVLFPLWPYALKYAIFMICLVLVIAILSLIVIRLFVYLICAVFGVSFWVLPNFFADVTIAQSFFPVYSAKKWQSGVFSIIGRFLAFSILAYYAYHAYTDSSWVYENIDITKTSLDDLHDWGVGKIKGEKNFSQSALTNLDHIMNQTATVEVDSDQSMNFETSQNQQNENEQQEQNEDEGERIKGDQENSEEETEDEEVQNEKVDSGQF